MKISFLLCFFFVFLTASTCFADTPPVPVDPLFTKPEQTPTQIAELVTTPTRPLTQSDIEQWVQKFNDREPTVRESAIRHLLPQPLTAAELTVKAFTNGNLNVRLTALELLREWNAPIEQLDPWKPDTFTPERLAVLEAWQKEIAELTEPLPVRELTAEQLMEAADEIARMLRVADEETEVIRERLARMGTAFLPLVYERLKTATTDRERQRLAALRYRLVASESLGQRWSPDGLLRLAAPETLTRRKSVEELTNLATSEDQTLLRELFSDPDPLVREIALRGLQKISGSAQTILLDLLTDPELNVRAAVLKQLEENPSNGMMAEPGNGIGARIIEYVQTETDADLVGHAVRVLRGLRNQGDNDATRCLIGLLKHDRWQVRADAASALGESVHGGYGMGRLSTNSNEAQQLQADVTAGLVELLSDSDSFVVSKAVEGLKDSGNVVAIEPFMQAIERVPDQANYIIEILVDDHNLLLRAQPQLLKLAAHENPKIRAAIYGSVPVLGEKELTAGMTDGESFVRIAAAKAVLRQLDSLRSSALHSERSSFHQSGWEPVRAEPAPTVFSAIGRVFGFGGSASRSRPVATPVALPDGGTATPIPHFDQVVDGVPPHYPVATALDGDEMVLPPVISTQTEPPMKNVMVPWKDAIDWVVEQSDLTLHADKMPVGTIPMPVFTQLVSTDTEKQLEMLNAELQKQDWVLIRKDTTLHVIYIPDGIPEHLQDAMPVEVEGVVEPPLLVYHPSNEIPPRPVGTVPIPQPIDTVYGPPPVVRVPPVIPVVIEGDEPRPHVPMGMPVVVTTPPPRVVEEEEEPTDQTDKPETAAAELQRYISQSASTVTPEVHDRWLLDFYEGKKRPEWTAHLIAPLEAMLTAESMEERVTAAAALVPLGRANEMVPLLMETAKTHPELFETVIQVVPWLTGEQRMALFREWWKAGEMDTPFLYVIIESLSEPADLRNEPMYWELLGEDNVPLDMMDGLFELLKPLYMIEKFAYDRSNLPPRRIQTELANKLTAWTETGTEYQRLVALAMLVSLDTAKAREVAERLDADTTISDELRFDAFQVRLMTQTNERSRTELAVEALKQRDSKRSRLAIRALVNTDDFLFVVLRNRLYLYLPSTLRISSVNQRNTQLVPKGLELEVIQPLLTDEDEMIAAYAGYFAVLLGDTTGIEPLLKYWRKSKKNARDFEDDEDTMTALVYRALAVLDDPQYVPLLREIYGTMQEHEVRDFYWSIRNTSGPEMIEFRKEIRDKHGMANLQ